MKAQQISQIFRLFCSVWFFFMCFLWNSIHANMISTQQQPSHLTQNNLLLPGLRLDLQLTAVASLSLTASLKEADWFTESTEILIPALVGLARWTSENLSSDRSAPAAAVQSLLAAPLYGFLFLPLALLSRLQVRRCLCGPFNLLPNPVQKKSPINKKWCHTFWSLSLHLKTSTLRPHGIGVCLQFSPPGCNRYRHLNEEHYS